MNLDLEAKGMQVIESLAQQKEEAAFLVRMGPTKPEDLIKSKIFYSKWDSLLKDGCFLYFSQDKLTQQGHYW